MTEERPVPVQRAPQQGAVTARVVVDALTSLAAERQLETLRALYALGDRVATARSHLDIHEAALDALMEAVHPDRASVLAYDESGVMRFQAWRRLSDGYRAAVDGHSPWTRDTEDPPAITIPDVAADEALGAFRPIILGEGIRACAFIPLVHQRHLLGKFMLYHDASHVYSHEELEAARAIAAHVAAALARWEAQAELSRLRGQLQHLEKMATLGSLVAGVAHEIRTPLTSLINSLHLVETRARRGGDPAVAEMASSLVGDALRINRLVEDLRRFTRLQSSERRVAPLEATVAEAVALFQAARKTSCRIEKTFHEAPPVPHDRVQVQQVVLNLLENALAASRATTAPIRVEVRGEGGRVLLLVRDEGIGMTPEVTARMWEEFYTTKEDGTGLGLSIVKRIVEAHGGSVECVTRPGAGTTFRVAFPAG